MLVSEERRDGVGAVGEKGWRDNFARQYICQIVGMGIGECIKNRLKSDLYTDKEKEVIKRYIEK